MTAAFKPYAKYKPSGVEWLGDVPEHWECRKLKHLFLEKPYANGASLPAGAISFGEVVFKSEEKLTAETKSSYQEVLSGEFLVNPINLNYDLKSLRTALSKINTCVSSAYIVLRMRNEVLGDPNYLKLMLHMFDIHHMKTLGAGVRQTINFSDIGTCITHLPPLKEQTAIAACLDSETAKIDETIKELEASVELLNEEKTSLINEYVTGKINPATGKPYPKYKPSGVEWLGDIPEHWEIAPLFSLGQERKEKNKGMLEDNLLSLSYGRIVRKDITSTDGLLPESFETYQIVRKGDIVFRLTDLQNDKRSLRSALVKEDGIITSAYLAIQPSGANSIFLNCLYRSYDTSKVFYSMGGGLRQSMKYDEMKRLPTLLPSSQEQSNISSFLDSETAKIDALITEKESLIETLKEYRTSLIHEAVTGKIDLRIA